MFFWKIFRPSCFNYTFWPILYFYRLLWYFTSQILMRSVTSWMEVDKSPFNFLVVLKSAVPNLEVRDVTRSSTAFLPLKGKSPIATFVSCQVQIQVLGSIYSLQTLLGRWWSSQLLVLQDLYSAPFEVCLHTHVSNHLRGRWPCTGGRLRHEVVTFLRW